MLEGQKVIYKGKETHVEKVLKNDRVMIANPDWDWDEEAQCVDAGIEYLVSYWITVNESELDLKFIQYQSEPHRITNG